MHQHRVGSIGQVAITVSDVSVALDYYCQVLGLKLLFRSDPNLAFVSDGALRIMLSTPQGEFAIASNSVLYFRVDDIQASFSAIVERGSNTERAPELVAQMQDHDLWLAFLRDPDGNLVGLMEEKSATRIA